MYQYRTTISGFDREIIIVQLSLDNESTEEITFKFSVSEAPSFANIEEKKILQRRSHSYVQQNPISHQKLGNFRAIENRRLSAVVTKYFKPIAKQTWQMDSSSWEFLNQTSGSPPPPPVEEVIPVLPKEKDESTLTDTVLSDKSNLIEPNFSEKFRFVDSGLDSTLSYTNKSDSIGYQQSELGTLNAPSEKSQLSKSRERIKDYVINQLSTADSNGLFGKMIAQFLDCTKRVGKKQIMVTLRNVRQFMNGMKNYLIRHGEGDLHCIINEERTKVYTVLPLIIPAGIINFLIFFLREFFSCGNY